MSPNEEMTQASRPKRPAANAAAGGAAVAAGTRLRRPAPSKDIEAGPQQQRRRNAPHGAASDHSDDTGIMDADVSVDPATANVMPETGAKRAPRVAAKSVKADAPSGSKSSKTAADKASDSDDSAPAAKPAKPSGKSGTASKAAKAGAKVAASDEPARTRPTNNQLLYKARFNWDHYPHPMIPGARESLPDETHGCASVTSAFLQVLKAIHTAELSRNDGGRNVLKLLSVNTRRTKVVALSTGTHRVPDELRRHQLADEEGNEYSTNLDRNRYGNDDQYLFTVIKFNLEALGLCPLIAQVEIIDAKAAAEECVLVVKVPDAGCTCDGGCVNGVRDGVHIAAREIVGGSAAQRESVARSNEQSAKRLESNAAARTPRGEAGKTKEQWRVPTTPMSPMKRNASAGDAGGMGMLLDALTQVGGMPPPSPLHLRSPPHGPVAGRRASFLSGGTNMAAASPSMRPAAAAMSALCASAPPSADRDAVNHMGGVGGVAQAAAAAAAAAQYYGLAAAGQSNAQAHLLAMQQHHEQQQLLFQSPTPLMQKFAAAAGFNGSIPLASSHRADIHAEAAGIAAAANESVLEELVERERGEAASARAAEAKANARVAELERELDVLKRSGVEGDADEEEETEERPDTKDVVAAAVKAEATAGAVQRETIAHRLVALEEEVAAFGARAETAATIGGEDAMTALYVAEARAHARALVRVARLEASIASGTRLDTKLEEGVHAEKAETTEMDAKEAEETAEEPASPSGVENVASEAAALSVQKRGRVSQTDDAGFFEPPPTKRPAVATRAGPGGQAGGPGYAPPTTPALADAPNGRGEGGILSPAQALHFAASGRA